jgi:hypothetical protein
MLHQGGRRTTRAPSAVETTAKQLHSKGNAASKKVRKAIADMRDNYDEHDTINLAIMSMSNNNI